MSALDLSQDTIRQRRNLIVTSVLLVFISIADVSFGDTVNFLGATLTIGKPEKIHQGLIIFLLYFLWRFYQYFSTDKAYNELCDQFKNNMERATELKIVQAICKPRGSAGLNGKHLYKNLKQEGFFTYCIEAKEPKGYDPVKGKNEETTFLAKISLVDLELSRLFTAFGFIFRARILTDYFAPYLLVLYAIYLQIVT